MQLIYKGRNTSPDHALPLAEGWPSNDHEEPDKDIAKAKIASGAYSKAETPRKDED